MNIIVQPTTDVSFPIRRAEGHAHLDQKLDKGGRSPAMGMYPGAELAPENYFGEDPSMGNAPAD